jgi:hypothetical protein
MIGPARYAAALAAAAAVGSAASWPARADMPAGAQARQERLVAQTSPAVAGVQADAKRQFPKLTSPADIDAIAFLALMQADQNLRAAGKSAPAAGWGASSTSGWGGASDSTQTNAQMDMSRLTQIEAALSNIMKSASDTSQAITQNLKQ